MTQKSGCAVAPWSALSNCSKFVPPLTTDHNFLYSPTPPSPSTSFSLISVIVHLILQSLLFTVHVSKPSQSTLKWLVSFPQFSNYCTFLYFFQSTFSYFCSCVCLLLTVFPLMEIQLLNILLVVFFVTVTVLGFQQGKFCDRVDLRIVHGNHWRIRFIGIFTALWIFPTRSICCKLIWINFKRFSLLFVVMIDCYEYYVCVLRI